MKAIETKQLRKSYGKTEIVKGISLTVEQGEIFGFLGRNGAGKSTFINMLTGIIHPTSGSFSLLGMEGGDNMAKKYIGVMPDYANLYGSLTAMAHLKYFSALSGKPAAKAVCMEVLQQVGLDEHYNKKTAKFSFGMKKKLGIAQAIIHDPELVFLDEPTSGLDAESVLHIQRLIRDLQKRGKTIFMTSHNLNEVEKLCTRIAILKEGRIVQSGSMDELRAAFRSTINVNIKHSPIPASQQESLHQWLEEAGSNLELNDGEITITVESEQKISEMIRAFQQCRVEIYRVHVKEPSLEDIFLEL
ncbi:ABC transporter ATP-binding protein [Bacillus massilinigeriensis]|uniref:ABC transporter ATP-binding protein n=1 Tax=Bacillus mediterraneensis TaxID=1805474 RepID=UPI0008F8A615|nr:ABC transporter ATP-binding protein [Bacillus mediterraneensis]